MTGEEEHMPVKEAEVAQSAVMGRTKAGHAGGDLLQLVSFRLGGEEYGLEILKVQEIIRMQDLTRVPNSPPAVEGVINLRGRVIPVIGMRKRFGMEPREHDKETRIVVVEFKGDVLGFEVDSVSEVLRIPAETVEPPPRISKHNNEYVSGVGKLPGRLLLLLDVTRLMGETEAAPREESQQANSPGPNGQLVHEDALVG
jgi:purine-binding chemotaxis protein CheW